MFENHRVGALLLMGGIGKRFGSETPKQFHRIGGKPIFRVTLEAFLTVDFCDEIVLCCHPSWMGRVEEELRFMGNPPSVHVVEAGETRQESSYRGLLGFRCAPEIVLIHDAVRPFISAKILRENVSLAIQHGAVDTCIPSTDTLVHGPDGQKIESIPNRAEFWRGQTPQTFSYPLILEAHRKTNRRDVSDDCRLVLDLGHKVWIARGDEHNLKITSELDLFVAEQLFRLHFHAVQPKQPTIAGKRYAVIGGTGGIGQAICNLLERNGAQAISIARSTAPFAMNLQDPESIDRMFFQLGAIDGLINCAGLLFAGPLEMLDLRQIEELLDVNLKGLILSCQKAKVKSGGHVINIASSAFSRGRKDMSVYSCTKAAVVNFTQALAEERPDWRVHAVIPPRTKTAMRLKNFPQEDPAGLLEPEEIAKSVVALLSDASSTGLLVEVKK